ncbi:hypothetical protein GCM10027093_09050 [Paraburkholderia jirisanensis]
MSRTFLYARVSTPTQDAQCQVQTAKDAGFEIAPHRVFSETISGSVPALSRPGFIRLIDRLEPGDTLVVTHLDRLGRNAMDISRTWELLERIGVNIRCFQLDGLDRKSPAGQMTFAMVAGYAEFERAVHIERTQAGLSRAKASGKHMGRPRVLTPQLERDVAEHLKRGETIASIARNFMCSRQTITRVREKLLPLDDSPLQEPATSSAPPATRPTKPKKLKPVPYLPPQETPQQLVRRILARFGVGDDAAADLAPSISEFANE